MRRFFRALRLLIGPLRLPKLVEWTNDDAAHLDSFLRSVPGAKLRQVMISRCAAMNEYAVTRNPHQIIKLAGQAQGCRDMMNLILSCAATNSGKTEQPADTNGTAGQLDHLRP